MKEDPPNKIRNKREVTNDTREIQKIVINYYEKLYAKKLDNLGKMNKFLETCNLPKLNKEEAENLNKQVTTSEIKVVIKKKIPAHKNPGLDCFPSTFIKHSKKNKLPFFLNYSKKFKKREHSQTLFIRPTLS